MDNPETLILLRRSKNSILANMEQEEVLDFGEPAYFNDDYMTVGNYDTLPVKQRNVIRFVPKDVCDKTVFARPGTGGATTFYLYDGSTQRDLITVGINAQDAVPVKDSPNNVTSNGIWAADEAIRNRVKSLEDGLANVKGKQVLTTLDPTDNESLVTSKAIADYIRSQFTIFLNNYTPWTMTGAETNKFYIDRNNGLQYYNGASWVTVPVAYTR